MRWNKFQETGRVMERRLTGLRVRLRGVMPRVGLVAFILFVVWLFTRGSASFRYTSAGRILGMLTLLTILFTVTYYGLKAMLRLKRILLWRVRRRLVITYLFVGLTPIVLLVLLGLFSAVGGASQAMMRIVIVQLSTTQRQAQESAHTLADAALKLPSNMSDAAAQVWLDERVRLLQASLPGAQVAVWRSGTGANAARLKLDAPAQFAAQPEGEETRPLGLEDSAGRTAPPAWLREQEEWSGLAFVPPPEDSRSAFGSPAVHSLMRARASGREAAVLVTVPICRALIRHYRQNTGINVRPFFIGVPINEVRLPVAKIEVDTGDAAPAEAAQQGSGDTGAMGQSKRPLRDLDWNRDQFGDLMPDKPLVDFRYPVILPATHWLSGERKTTWAFVVDWSWAEGGKQFWGDAITGPAWWQALVAAGAAFLLLELLALFSAAWMTRAVTGTVHRLYVATEFIKRGDFSHRVKTRSHDQLGELALAFNDMSANIESLLTERVRRERLEREVEIAAEVQAQLFPRRVPRLSNAAVTGECRAARGVAGDYYDYIEAAPGLVAFALGDVSGKGVSASLVMSNLQAALRAQVTIIAERLKVAGQAFAATTIAGGAQGTAASGDAQTGEMPCGVTGVDTSCVVSNMTASINEQLCSSTDANRFATLFLALYDERTRFLRYTNAGHNAALLVRADGSIERLTTGGIIVGAFDWVRFEEAQTILDAGDLLLVFSDGISEAQNAAGEEYGEERLAQFAVTHRDKTAEEFRRILFDEIDKWSGAVERGDDQTLVILKSVTNGE